MDIHTVHVLPVSVDTDRFEPMGQKHHGEKLGLVYVGSINELRGLDTVVDGFPEQDPQTRSELRLDLVG